MNSRERVLAAIKHIQPDKVPVDFGGMQSGIHIKAYKKLLEYLHIRDDNIRYCDYLQQTALPCEELLKRFNSDTRYLHPHSALLSENFEPEIEGKWAGVYDQFGVFWGNNVDKKKEEILYCDPVIHPLADMNTVSEIKNYDWPDGKDRNIFIGIRETAENLRKETEYAIVSRPIGCIFEYTTFLFGFTRVLRYLRTKPELIIATMEELAKYWSDHAETFFNEIGNNIDVVCVNGDLAEQAGPIMNPNLYKKIIKPIEWEFSSKIHSLANVRINYHTCGSASVFYDDFAQIGYNAVNPVQISAYDMEPCSLKRRFGNTITFWGGLCNTQYTLPFGTPEQIREEVRKNVDCFKNGGGYIAANIHNITAEVPPGNITAMFDAISE